MNEALLILGMMAVTFGARYPILALFSKIELPDPVFRALKYVPPVALMAIIAPATLMPNGAIDLNLDNSFLYAGIISGLIAWRTKNLLLTILLGMGSLLLWRAIF